MKKYIVPALLCLALAVCLYLANAPDAEFTLSSPPSGMYLSSEASGVFFDRFEAADIQPGQFDYSGPILESWQFDL
ncbi:MAG: hypothetical protein LBT36_06545, partial [Oscillospiraceae bacterium]|nr:hypothetical protein [Oscillospiraceae bacterium]